jgi:flavin-dependent dehydrogenase
MIDVLVAGGGPAGFTVVVVEKRSGTIDKACGEGLMPHSLAHLNRLGSPR